MNFTHLPLICALPMALAACGGTDFASSSSLLAEEMAGDHPACTRPHRDLSAADTDGDGELSDAERQAFRDARRADLLAAFDADGDGELSQAERDAARLSKRLERFAELDADASGGLSQVEVADACRLAEHFDELDADEDGEISSDEFTAERWHARRRGDMGHRQRR